MNSALIQHQTEFENRVPDFSKISRKMDIFETPFAVDISNLPSDLQIKVIDLQNDTSINVAFKEKN